MTAKAIGSDTADTVQDGRARLIRAALHLFATRGFEGASIANIAEEAGVSKGLARFHFGSKRDLYEAVGKHLEEKWDDGGEPQVGTLDMKVYEDRFLERFRFFRRVPDDMGFLHRTLMEDDEPLPMVKNSYNALKDFIKAQREGGGGKGDVPTELAALVWMSTELGLLFFQPKLAEIFGIDLEDEGMQRTLSAAYISVFRALMGGTDPHGDDQKPSDL
ncbi:TetR/AcrR family transcriptional regulator [Kordiimonas gwangyangensis]|uniref:TetR/AcrR family transcriptional regulator n=1 Tax=Kordiimonas gwangyangensis TaxID=288022 RepID=UPI00035F69E9|nr:TetR/AcrR family transcriptional regulator [Kordiimonas gwangyangensis]